MNSAHQPTAKNWRALAARWARPALGCALALGSAGTYVLAESDAPGLHRIVAASQPATPPAAAPEAVPADAPREPQKLALDDLVSMAMARHPALTVAGARIDAARGAMVQAGLPPNPRAGYVGDEMNSEGTAGFQGGFVEQTIITGGKLRLSRAAASHDVSRTQADFAAAEQRVINDVRSGYYDVLIAQRALSVTDQLVTIADRSQTIAERLWKQGAVSEADFRQSRVEAQMVHIKQAAAKNRHVASWRQLAALVGEPCMPQAELVDDLQNGVPELTWCDVVDRTLAGSPELAAAWADIEKARLSLRRAQAESIPDVTLQAGIHRDNVAQETVASAMASIPLPIWNTNQGGIRQAAAEVRRATADAQRIELRLRQQLAAAFARYETASVAVTRYNKDILSDAETTLNLIKKVYEAGEIDYFKQLTAQRTYFQTRLEYIETLGELRKSAVQLEGYLLGGSLEAMK